MAYKQKGINFGKGTKGPSPNKVKKFLTGVIGGAGGVALGGMELAYMGIDHLERKAHERDMNAPPDSGFKKWEDLTAEQKKANLPTMTKVLDKARHEEFGGPKTLTFYDTYSKEDREKYNKEFAIKNERNKNAILNSKIDINKKSNEPVVVSDNSSMSNEEFIKQYKEKFPEEFKEEVDPKKLTTNIDTKKPTTSKIPAVGTEARKNIMIVKIGSMMTL